MAFDEMDNSNANSPNREFEGDERVFFLGTEFERRIQVTLKDIVDTGDNKHTIRRGVQGACGCSTRLADLYGCFNCHGIFCPRHTSVFGCSACSAPTLCFRCSVLVGDESSPEAPPVPLCATCFEAMKPSLLKAIFGGLFSLLKSIFRRKETAVVKREE
jgi:hypothetical protein